MTPIHRAFFSATCSTKFIGNPLGKGTHHGTWKSSLGASYSVMSYQMKCYDGLMAWPKYRPDLHTVTRYSSETQLACHC